MGHMAKDCPQGGGGRACHNCGQEGHISKECDQPRNTANMTCTNCEETGHWWKECPKPKDCKRPAEARNMEKKQTANFQQGARYNALSARNSVTPRFAARSSQSMITTLRARNLKATICLLLTSNPALMHGVLVRSRRALAASGKCIYQITPYHG